jgi:hypothetical protein
VEVPLAVAAVSLVGLFKLWIVIRYFDRAQKQGNLAQAAKAISLYLQHDPGIIGWRGALERRRA